MKKYIMITGLLIAVLMTTACTSIQDKSIKDDVESEHISVWENEKPEEETKKIIEGIQIGEEQGVEVEKDIEIVQGIEGGQEIVFEVLPISEDLQVEMTGISYKENDHITFDDLRVVRVGYIDFNDAPQMGELVVHKAIGDKVVEVFEELYEKRFPIERMERIDVYNGDDDLSMAANNTSAFNYREIAGTDRLSNHAYGLAIDINPIMNPYVTSRGVYPPEGEVYKDRNEYSKGMIVKDGPCYTAFIEAGFTWGGDWKNGKDYQHFEIEVLE